MFVARFRVREAKNFCLLLTFALGGQQIFIFCSLSRWGSSKFLFVACFRVGEAKNFCLLLTFALGGQQIFYFLLTFMLGKRHPTAFCLPLRIFRENARRFRCPDIFSAKTRDVLLALTHFLQKRATFCLPRRVFCKNARRFPRPNVFFAKTRGVFFGLAQKEAVAPRWGAAMRWVDKRCWGGVNLLRGFLGEAARAVCARKNPDERMKGVLLWSVYCVA